MKFIVSKFGGTSMGDERCMRQSAQLACRQGSRVVVVSATAGTTNHLVDIGQAAEVVEWPVTLAKIDAVINRHQNIAKALKLNSERQTQLQALFNDLQAVAQGIYLLKECSLKAMDTLLSFGERLSSVLFAQALENVITEKNLNHKVIWVDARDYIRTDHQFGKARPQIEAIAEACKPLNEKLRQDEKLMAVTQGYIGSTKDHKTTTLGRGGSDYSGALFAEGLNATALEIWTDVAGIATTDPRVCKEAKPIKEISFTEASELAVFGAKVLHPSTLMPAMRKQIPVFVGSTFAPDETGTWVLRQVSEGPLVRALAIRKKQVLITLTTPEMLHGHGFLHRIFAVFNQHHISVDAITTSEISVALTIDDSALGNHDFLAELRQFAEVSLEENVCLVSVIGNNINHTPGVAQKIFAAIGDINVRMICQGASRHNFCVLVSEHHGDEAIRRLHSQFI